MLTLSELFCFGVFLIVLRVSIVYKLGKWCDVPPPEESVGLNRSDTDIEHGSMDYAVGSFKDIICPIDSKTLAQVKTCLKITRFLEIFQFVYFTIVTILSVLVVEYSYVLLLVFVEVLLVCMPVFYILSWKYKTILLLKME